ncbi:MAG TPA: spore coat protein U domain-containing protein [Xanthobacteraceae bacterium]
MRARCAIAAALGLGFTFGAGPAFAQSCSFTIATLDFGSINLAANTTFTSTTTYQASCTGNPNTTVRTCPNIDVGSGGSTSGSPRFLVNGATALNFNLYQDGAYASVWGSNLWGFAGSYPSPTVDVALNGSGNGSASLTVFGQVWAGQPTLPAGVYSSSFTGTQSSVAYAYSTVGNCATIGNSHATTAAFTVTANNATICAVSAATLNFGSTGVLRAVVDGTGSITITCTNAAPYTAALDGGLSGAANPTQRKMSQGLETITYGLYQDSARAVPWGSSVGVNTMAGTGIGLVQRFTVYGRVPAQSTPSPGTYSDTVVLTISY